MKIKSISFRNIKSYGNKIQNITFDDDGGLILLHGDNGSGKSSIKESIELSVFNQVIGKKGTRISATKLPNRTNKNLETNIIYENNSGDEINILRNLAPKNFSIKVNSQDYLDKYKTLNKKEREDLVGFNYQTFRSFISMSMNDFLNFITMEEVDKNNLLTRLFNLEEIDTYSATNDELLNQNTKNINRLTSEVKSTITMLMEYKKIINNVEKANEPKDNIDGETLKNEISELKTKYLNKQKEITEIDNKLSDFEVKVQEFRNSINITKNESIKRTTEVHEINEKIKLFESGKCPSCYSDLHGEEHIKILSDIKAKKVKFDEILLINENKVLHYRSEISVINSQMNVLNDTKIKLTDEFIDIKTESKVAISKYNSLSKEKPKTIDVSEIKEKGKELLQLKKKYEGEITDLKKERETLLKLKDILSDKGAKKTIISNLIPSLNEILSKQLNFIKYPYMVHLDDELNAVIKDRDIILDIDDISNGEMRMLNICIALSYIEMVRKNKNINLLFMDEIFLSVDLSNISMLLELLKQFSIDNKLHIFLVHHGLETFDTKYFKQCIRVNKDKFFSDMDIIQNNYK